ncbi:sensor histidine kinase [Comamonas sp. C24C]
MSERKKCNLKPEYFLGCIALAIILVLPISRLSFVQYQTYRSIQNTEAGLLLIQDGLRAYEAVSAERGPANSFLGSFPEQEHLARQNKLSDARARTDRELNGLEQRLVSLDCLVCSSMRADIRRVRTELTQGRASFDAIYALHPAQLEPGRIRAATEKMFQATSPFVFFLDKATQFSNSGAPKLMPSIILARLSGEFREYAGRYGSYFTEGLVRSQKFTESDLHDALIVEGRIYQLRDSVLAQAQSIEENTRINEATTRVQREYFENSLTRAQEIMKLWPWQVGEAMTPAQFADVYVPGMASIIELRNSAMADAMQHWKCYRSQVTRTSIILITIAVIVEILLIWFFFKLWIGFISPLAGFSRTLSILYTNYAQTSKKDKMLSELSHDMKSPQAGIIALLDLAKTTHAYEAEPELFGKIESYSRRTLTLIDDFVSISRMRTIAYEPEEIDLRGVLLDAYDHLAVFFHSKNIQANITETDDEAFFVYAERGLLLRGIINVVENAVKFSPEKSRVDCRLSRENNDIVLEISDNGYGISPENIPNLFKQYRRFHTPGQPHVPGTGLGLSFVKALMDRTHGKISCQSALGKGTKFTLKFPNRPPLLFRVLTRFNIRVRK